MTTPEGIGTGMAYVRAEQRPWRRVKPKKWKHAQARGRTRGRTVHGVHTGLEHRTGEPLADMKLVLDMGAGPVRRSLQSRRQT
jgi:hypothetical protein